MRVRPMLNFAVVAVASVLTVGLTRASADGAAAPTTMPASAEGVHAFSVQDIDGKTVDLSSYKGHVLLIVNVASKCGFTPQYAGLEKLYEQRKDSGFVILGFPANNFNHQEPGTADEIKAFCTGKYNVTFPMMAKLSVKGDDKAPLFKFLTEPATAGDKAAEVGWNFNKFLIGKDGKLIQHYLSKTTPEDPELAKAIDAATAAN